MMLKNICLVFLLLFLCVPVSVYAEVPNVFGTESSSGSSSSSAKVTNSKVTTAKNQLNEVLTNSNYGLYTILRGAGAFTGAYGFIKLLMSFKDDRPEEKLTAGGLIMVGLILIAIPTLTSQITTAAGF